MHPFNPLTRVGPARESNFSSGKASGTCLGIKKIGELVIHLLQQDKFHMAIFAVNVWYSLIAFFW